MILLGIGSNLSSSFGNRFKNVDLSISSLEEVGVKLIKKSSYYESLSYPNTNHPKFINIVVEIKTSLPPEDLASVLLFVENSLERKRLIKNEPRTCDIDILDYNSQILNFNYNNMNFIIPHEKLIYRSFVLYPLQEIKPNWKHPKTKEHIDELIEKLSIEQKKSILKIKKH